ncbi:hypothetical protein ACFVHS_38470 [Streptomyces sp. NPDC057746]|uniref:hypothetical protein n=1 Tax=Streptomyces sp. NPDC057746 TaxID=3346237 RepID=UPI0036BE4A75
MATEDPHGRHPLSARQLPDQLSAVGPGWHPLLLRLHEQLLDLDPDYQLDDLKEKLGTARIRITGSMGLAYTEMQTPVAAAEEQSATVCEFCGSPARRRRRGDTTEGWIKAVCDNCHRDWSHHTIVIINGSVRRGPTRPTGPPETEEPG